MTVYLLRHGATACNREGRYQGRLDGPLSPEGAAALKKAEFDVDAVYVSPMLRARQTAAALFPGAALIPVPGLEEMDFGAFEGRRASEMEHDAAYRAWVAGGCLGPTPGGEDRASFSGRVCRAFAGLVDAALASGRKRLVIVAHGGVQMAVMERFALPRRDYYQWCGPLAGGWVLEADAGAWASGRTLRLVDAVEYTREAI